MSQPILKTLIFALCATLVGASVTPAFAVETSYDYCQVFTDDEQHRICQSVLVELQPVSQADLLETLKAAVAAVERQLPKFNALKEVPYAEDMATKGNPCGAKPVPETDPWNMSCGPWGAKMLLAIELAGVTITGLETMQDPAVQALYSKTFKELIDLGKADAKYTDDAEFRTEVDNAEQNYNVGMSLLRAAVLYFDKTTDVESMTAAELIAILQALPEYGTYKLELNTDGYSTGLYSSYFVAKGFTLYSQTVPDNTDYGEQGIYNSIVSSYAYLVTAATSVDPNFKVALTSFQEKVEDAPTAPNTGTTAAELSATIISLALGGVAMLAGIIGSLRIFQLYHRSSLKRRK